MATEQSAPPPEMVTLTVDGREVTVKKGTNLIEAAKQAGVEVPHYCYHPHLSIAGNCRMCQIQVKGQPKLTIGCNTVAAQGMEVLTHQSSAEVADAQAATLEFILINHPLDCTVCDQAGHCKLQDYHFEYNARSSRFLEEKVNKVKAVPLGPTVMLDGERCIMCTRCIRFCDEITKTSELGMLNRGDQSVIAVSPGRELDNPLSGTVVDLCPVGALTHKEWRFNTRIWFTKQTETICPGCSTGCNSKVAVRDGQVVQVKARRNDAVNKEWMCDEGRYGMKRYLPANRVKIEGGEAAWTQPFRQLREALKGALILLAPDLTLEDYSVIKRVIHKLAPSAKTVIAYRERRLTETEAILISPDYAANFRGAEFSGVVSGDLTQSYEAALGAIRSGESESVIFVGDHSVDLRDLNPEFLLAISRVNQSIAIVTDQEGPLANASKTVIPGRSILEKSGLLMNGKGRLQYTQAAVDPLDGTLPEWKIFLRMAESSGMKTIEAALESDRDATRWLLSSEDRFSGLSIASIKNGGIPLEHTPVTVQGAGGSAGVQAGA